MNSKLYQVNFSRSYLPSSYDERIYLEKKKKARAKGKKLISSIDNQLSNLNTDIAKSHQNAMRHVANHMDTSKMFRDAKRKERARNQKIATGVAGAALLGGAAYAGYRAYKKRQERKKREAEKEVAFRRA